MEPSVKYLEQFYELMQYTKKLRKKIVKEYFEHRSFHFSGPSSRSFNSKRPERAPEHIFFTRFSTDLKQALERLENIPRSSDGKYILIADESKKIYLDLSYEIGELKKDLFFVTHSEEEFYTYLADLHPEFYDQVEKGFKKLKGIFFENFITDRDGTVNNYCGRYRSSIQSIYNSIFLSRFAANRTTNSIVLTSAPLDNGGLVDISIDPEGIFIYAGSKGREYMDRRQARGYFPIPDHQQQKLDLLNTRINRLIEEPDNQIFSLIGSGVQFKFGQTTVARQDIYGSIPEQQSHEFLRRVENLVNDIDPDQRYFKIEDTGKDIEIILTVENTDEKQIKPGGKTSRTHEETGGDEPKQRWGRDFDKGDGIAFLDRALELNLNRSRNLICGDTASDTPMVKKALEKNKNTWAVFVTRDQGLKNEVAGICPNSYFVSEPDILISILNNLGKEGG